MVSDMVMIVSHNMHNNYKLESCHSHENKQFHDFSMTFWEIFIFQDFSMTFHDNHFFQDFPGFSMTVGTLIKMFGDSSGVQSCKKYIQIILVYFSAVPKSVPVAVPQIKVAAIDSLSFGSMD